jgi:hypothetical protein
MVFASFSRRARNASRRRFRSRLSVLAFMTKATASPMTPRTTVAIQAIFQSIGTSPRTLPLYHCQLTLSSMQRRRSSAHAEGFRSFVK